VYHGPQRTSLSISRGDHLLSPPALVPTLILHRLFSKRHTSGEHYTLVVSLFAESERGTVILSWTLQLHLKNVYRLIYVITNYISGYISPPFNFHTNHRRMNTLLSQSVLSYSTFWSCGRNIISLSFSWLFCVCLLGLVVKVMVCVMHHHSRNLALASGGWGGF
jgi:hypothetical protein